MRAVVFDEAADTGPVVCDVAEPGAGGVVTDVLWSAVNYKDYLVGRSPSRARRVPRLTLGVEASGVVRTCRSGAFSPGDPVVLFGGAFGVGADGGFAPVASAPSRYVTRLPRGLDPRRGAVCGLAGYTAMASVLLLERSGLAPGDGEVIVTGATGGVGSLAVSVLAARGHRVVASTGSAEHEGWLRALGAHAVIGRDDIADRPDRTLGTERWAGAVDCVGGATLGAILRSLRYGAAVAASGLVGGAELTTSVYPFIVRSVSLLGVDAVEATPTQRDHVFAQLATTALPDAIVERTIGLTDVPGALGSMGSGATRGRWLVETTA